MKVAIDREQRQLDLEKEVTGTADKTPKTDPQATDDGKKKKAGELRLAGPTATEEYRSAFNKYLLFGPNEYGRHLDEAEAREVRALQADSDEAGGYLIAPQQFITKLIEELEDEVFMRQFATVETVTNADSLGAPSLDADIEDATWTGEITAADEDTAMDFGKREWHPHALAKLIKVSNPLLRKSTQGVEALIRRKMAYKFGVTMEKAYLTGTGALQPLGVFTASALGISTARDISAGNTTTAIGLDGLFEAKFSLKGAYLARSRWIYHRDAVKMIAKMKDGDGRPIWQDSIRTGEPDILLSRPVHMSEYAPNTFTSGLYVGILGDFSFYWIADALGMTVQRLLELYALTNQTGFIGRLESDGMPVLENAFSRVTLT